MKNFALRFPDEQLHEAIKASAEHNRRSLNNEILRAVEFYLTHAPEAHYEVKPKEKERLKKSPKQS